MEYVEGQPRDVGVRSNRDSRYAPTAEDYKHLDGKAPRLQFGDRGELTAKTIEQAGLTGEERKRAQEMLKLQAVYLEIFDALEHPQDPDGHIVDLSGIHFTQPRIAIAWTLALLGMRPSGKKYIKKRFYSGPGVIEGAYAWVDSRAPDTALEELLPEHSADDHHLPPDTRKLAAQRDGAPGQQLPPGWSVTPTITDEFVPREEAK